MLLAVALNHVTQSAGIALQALKGVQLGPLIRIHPPQLPDLFLLHLDRAERLDQRGLRPVRAFLDQTAGITQRALRRHQHLQFARLGAIGL